MAPKVAQYADTAPPVKQAKMMVRSDCLRLSPIYQLKNPVLK